MFFAKSWPILVAADAIATVSSLLRNKRQEAKPASNADLQQWENEGGSAAPSEASSPAPSGNAREIMVTTGCA